LNPTDLIKLRRSIRKYAKEDVPQEIIDDILACAVLAPTARNEQPWLVGVVTDKLLLKQLASMTDYGKFIAEAPACFTVFCIKSEKYYLEDGCAATMNVILACSAHDLGSCWVAGDKKKYAEDVRKLLNVPAEYALVSLVPAGYPAEKPSPKNKKPLKQVTFRNRV